MDSATATVLLAASRDEVFDYLSRIESVPEWASEFVQSFQVVGPNEARARTGMGDVTFRVEPDTETGVIDMLVGPGEGARELFPTRVVSRGPDRSAFVFTMFRGKSQSQEAFEAGFASLGRELENLVRRFGNGAEGSGERG